MMGLSGSAVFSLSERGKAGLKAPQPPWYLPSDIKGTVTVEQRCQQLDVTLSILLSLGVHLHRQGGTA